MLFSMLHRSCASGVEYIVALDREIAQCRRSLCAKLNVQPTDYHIDLIQFNLAANAMRSAVERVFAPEAA